MFNNCYIYFIGFSVGAVLARSIMIKLWNLPYFSAEVLFKNVACIVFGSPIVSHEREISCVHKTCHTFQLEGDIQMLRLIDDSFYSLLQAQLQIVGFFNLSKSMLFFHCSGVL